MHCIDVDEAGFEVQVLEASRQQLVLVDFWAPWCGPCRVLGPVLERVAEAFAGRVRVAKVNSDDNPGLSSRFGVRGIPNVKAFLDGRVVDEFTGALPESSVRAFVERLLPGPGERARVEAAALRTEGRPEEAIAMLLQAVQDEPRNDAIRLDLAEILFEEGRVAEARDILAAMSPLADRDPDRARRLASLRMAMAAGGLDEPQLRARLAAQAADQDARIALAQALLARGEHEQGLELLLESVRMDRRHGDEAARRAMLHAFDLLGSGHPAVARYRRLLAGTLH